MRRSPQRSLRAWLGVPASLGLLLVATLACARLGSSPSSAPAVQATQPSQAPADPWGPLAVTRGLSGGDMSRAEGTIRITDSCVLLEDRKGHTDILQWGAGQTTWDPETNEVQFRNRDGEIIAVRDGQDVALGGSGEHFSDDPTDRDAVPRDEWMDRMDWVAEPDPSCTYDGSWSVGNVVVEPWGPLAVSVESMVGEIIDTEGVVRLSTACAVLEGADGTSALLVWPRDDTAETRWDQETSRIQFRNWSAAAQIEIGDGQAVALSGSGQPFSDDPSEPDVVPQDWIASFDWIAAPDPSCTVDSYWAVSDVTLIP